MDSDIPNIFLHLTTLVFLLSLSAFFSGSEVALFSLSKPQVERLRQESNRSSRFVARILDNPRRLLITILVGNTLVNTASASIIASLTTNVLGNRGIGIAVGISTFLLLIFGETTPKSIAVRNAEPISKFVVYPLYFFSKLIFPIRVILRSITVSIMRLLGVDGASEEDRITVEELKTAVDIAGEEQAIGQQEKEMINAIFDLRNITAAEIMVPRTEMVCASDDMTLQQLFELSRTERHSRIPVYRDDIDHIFGIAYMRDFPAIRNCNMTIGQFLEWRSDQDLLIKQPFFAPETRTAIGLLQDFRDQKAKMAILVDEYGGTAGLVTIEDIVEELVGEITSGRDTTSNSFRIIDDSTAIVSGRTSIRNVNKRLGLGLPLEEDVDTIGGYVISRMGRFPSEGEVFNFDGLEFKIMGVDEHRITEVQIKKVQEEE